jgi:speckle-type POZ protein
MYMMERPGTICQSILSNTLAVNIVAATLVLANHHCDMLKDACMEFIIYPIRLGDVEESHGYAKLKATCLSVLVEIVEKSCK